ncbi:hypothetical protein Hanom_Chr05g00405831 [Helianthus anomalus]
MMIDDQFKDIQKSDDDILDLRSLAAETIRRLTKGPEPRVKRMICRINNPAYVALENDTWRHDNSNSENENEKMNEMVEKKTRWWFVKYGKRKRTPKTSPVVPIPTEPTPKIVVKGPSGTSQQKLVDDPVVDPTKLIKQGTDLLNMSYADYLKKNEEVAAQNGQSTSSRVIPRNVRARKGGATLLKDQGGKKEKHVETSKVSEAEKDSNVEIPKEPEVQNVEVPKVEVTRVRASTPPPPPPPENVDIPESSQQKKIVLPDMFEGFPNVSGEYKDDFVLGDDFDMFNNAAVKALQTKVGIHEQEKANVEAKHDVLKK